MSSLVPLSATDAVVSTSQVYAGMLPLLGLITLVVLLFEKHVTTVGVAAGFTRLSRCIGVATWPLLLAAAAIGAYELATVLA